MCVHECMLLNAQMLGLVCAVVGKSVNGRGKAAGHEMKTEMPFGQQLYVYEYWVDVNSLGG